MRDYNKLIERQKNKKHYIPPPLPSSVWWSTRKWVPLLSALTVLVLWLIYN